MLPINTQENFDEKISDCCYAAKPIAVGAIVLGYLVAKADQQPRLTMMRHCDPVPFTRLYKGYGWVRAETGTPPRRGYGKLIGCADKKSTDHSNTIWLLIED